MAAFLMLFIYLFVLGCVQKKRGSEGVEEDLARARAAILRASQRKTHYLQHTEVDFIPRGSIYRNSFAFHQSHIEMRNRFKVWVYKEGEAPLVHSGPMHDIYSIEGHFIDEMESGRSSFIASHPDEAHAFFLPVSVASIIDYVYMPITTYARDQLQRVVADYIRLVADKYPYWNRSGGADHFLVACHDWGPDVSEANPKLYKNVIRVLCNANTSERFEPRRDVSMPDVYCPPGELGPPNLSQPPHKRPILAFFAGGAHGYIRELLLEHWKGKDNEVQVYGYLQKGQNYTQLMGQTKFCLCPSGYQVASPRVVEAIYAGCIPVIISDNFSLPFNDVFNWNQFSVQIPVHKIPEIKAILRGIPFAKYLRMQKRVRRVRRHFELNRPAEPFDVMHMVLHSVWLRRLNVRIPF
ncbi:Exostosin, GT47 domain [Dillenia turbinata]|uniref:Exostosin, GT47 domain n=1 Tax=Dillenia turbinata TaxID=194707 RepID=A0AAN8W8K8_9MAGN